MNYQIEHWAAFKAFGIANRIKTNETFAFVPQIWEKGWKDGTMQKFKKYFPDYRPAGFLGIAECYMHCVAHWAKCGGNYRYYAGKGLQCSISKLIETLDYFGISHNEKVIYTRGREIILPECCIVNVKSDYINHLDNLLRGAYGTSILYNKSNTQGVKKQQ